MALRCAGAFLFQFASFETLCPEVGRGDPGCRSPPPLRPDRHSPKSVAAELRAGKLAEAAHAERVRYNKAYYSLDCDDGIEYSACVHEPSPQELLERMDRFCHLWNAINSLPEIQGRRVDAHLILGKSYREIARDEGVDKSAVRSSVLCGIEAMKKYLRKNL